MKTIRVSNPVYGAIWLRALESDKTEDDVLRRLLDLKDSEPLLEQREIKVVAGFIDRRFGVIFPQGFRIFRTYKGRDFIATAVDGEWLLESKGRDSEVCSTLAKLSAAVGAKTENAWYGWKFEAKDGRPRWISDLRDPANIGTRSRE